MIFRPSTTEDIQEERYVRLALSTYLWFTHPLRSIEIIYIYIYIYELHDMTTTCPSEVGWVRSGNPDTRCGLEDEFSSSFTTPTVARLRKMDGMVSMQFAQSFSYRHWTSQFGTRLRVLHCSKSCSLSERTQWNGDETMFLWESHYSIQTSSYQIYFEAFSAHPVKRN